MQLLQSGVEALSELREVFLRDCFCELHVYCYKASWNNGQWTYSASVKFQNGPTGGEQKFTADNFGALVQKVEAFLKTLKQ